MQDIMYVFSRLLSSSAFTLKGFGVKRIFLYLDILLGVGYSDKSRIATRTIYFSIGIAVEENHAKTKKISTNKAFTQVGKIQKEGRLAILTKNLFKFLRASG